jgi:hypothetical protein
MPKYNINCNVKIQLTPVGLDIMENYYLHDKEAIRMKRIGNYYRMTLDEMMMIFGDHCYMNNSPIFVDNLIIME